LAWSRECVAGDTFDCTSLTVRKERPATIPQTAGPQACPRLLRCVTAARALPPAAWIEITGSEVDGPGAPTLAALSAHVRHSPTFGRLTEERIDGGEAGAELPERAKDSTVLGRGRKGHC
jgi:hypothetical protein